MEPGYPRCARGKDSWLESRLECPHTAVNMEGGGGVHMMTPKLDRECHHSNNRDYRGIGPTRNGTGGRGGEGATGVPPGACLTMETTRKHVATFPPAYNNPLLSPLDTRSS